MTDLQNNNDEVENKEGYKEHISKKGLENRAKWRANERKLSYKIMTMAQKIQSELNLIQVDELDESYKMNVSSLMHNSFDMINLSQYGGDDDDEHEN